VLLVVLHDAYGAPAGTIGAVAELREMIGAGLTKAGRRSGD